MKKDNKLYSLLLWEITGASIVAAFIWMFDLNATYYAMIPFTAIPAAIAFEGVGNFIFRLMRNKSFCFDLKQTLNGFKKNESALLNLNVNRSFFVLCLVAMILTVSKQVPDHNHMVIMICSISGMVIFMYNICRFEYYFRASMYVKKSKR